MTATFEHLDAIPFVQLCSTDLHLRRMAVQLAQQGRGIAAGILASATEAIRSEGRRRIVGAPLRAVHLDLPGIEHLLDAELEQLARALGRVADGLRDREHGGALVIHALRLSVEQERHDRGIHVDLAACIESEADRAAMECGDLESLAALADPRMETIH